MVAKVLIGLNLLVFVLTTLQAGLGGRGGDLQTRMVVYGPAIEAGEWYRLFSAGFVHFGLLHVGFNMVLLYRFGEMLEPVLGRVRFLALYVGALLAGSFGAVLLDPLAFTGGASGAVFGVVAAAALGVRQQGISVWESGIGGLLAVNLVITFVIPGISIGGHLGGLVGGAVIGAAMLRSRPSRTSTVVGVAVAVVVSGLSIAGAVAAAAG
jgi:membrane associated rhomboid family serine protease